VSWCDRCNWNISPQVVKPPSNLFESVYLSLGQRLGDRLLRELKAGGSPRPRLTVSRVLAFFIAALVHSATLVFAALGVALLVVGWPHVVILFFGVLCLLLAWFTRPDFGKLPEDITPRAELPRLYHLVDTVSQALGTSRVHGIVIGHDFNASIAQVGLRRRKVMWLGLPLVSVLDGQELVGLLGHEVAHGVNGDPVRSSLIGTALDSLIRWDYLVRPDWEDVEGVPGLLMVPVNLAALGVSYSLRGCILALAHLMWRDSQRSEYMADLLGARVSGTTGQLAMLENLLHHPTFGLVVQSTALTGSEADVFDEFERRLREVPERELERRRRVALVQETRLDSTHPPTPHRIEFLQAHPVSGAQVVCPHGELEAIRRELVAFRPKIQRKLVSLYKDNLYFG